jgi:glycosyltransferase involved in cell wall biosynthesis
MSLSTLGRARVARRVARTVLAWVRGMLRDAALARMGRRSYAWSARQLRRHTGRATLVFLCEEFFHADLRGFGGFGKTVQNIAGYFNTASSSIAVKLFLPQHTSLVTEPEFRRYHDTDVLLRPVSADYDGRAFAVYHRAANFPGRKVFISIDWYPSYLYPLYAASAVPLIVWIRDPRDQAAWVKLGSVPDELPFRGVRTVGELVRLAGEKQDSIRQLMALQRRRPRKIVFATKSVVLAPPARRTYGLPDMEPHLLPTPLHIPELATNELSARPSLLFLGRLDPQKRPWIAFEIARRHPHLDVIMAGTTHRPSLMERWNRRYASLPNLKRLGHVDGADKDLLLRRCWAILNTSVYETVAGSALEGFTYGKCAIACHQWDNEISNFGYYTGELPGEGLDEQSLRQVDAQIDRFLSHPEERLEKGRLGREAMKSRHTFAAFHERLSRILEIENIG